LTHLRSAKRKKAGHRGVRVVEGISIPGCDGRTADVNGLAIYVGLPILVSPDSEPPI